MARDAQDGPRTANEPPLVSIGPGGIGHPDSKEIHAESAPGWPKGFTFTAHDEPGRAAWSASYYDETHDSTLTLSFVRGGEAPPLPESERLPLAQVAYNSLVAAGDVMGAAHAEAVAKMAACTGKDGAD